jgi:hypothetical protein
MTKARTIANLGTGFVNITDTGTEGTKVASGTSAQRGSTAGQFRYNTTTGKFEGRNASDFIALEPTPTVSGVDVTEVDSSAGGTQTFVISGTNFSSGGTITFVGSDGTEVTANSTTFNSTTQVTAVEDKATFINAKEPWKIKFTSAGGNSGQSTGLIYQDQNPSWTTAAGNLGTFLENSSVGTIQLTATDPDSDTINYSIQSGTLPTGLGLNASTGAITGTTPSVSGDTTSSFTIRATANSKTVDRSFNIITKNVITDALLFDATNLDSSSNTQVYTSNTDGASVGLKLNNGNAISVNTAVQLSRINGVTDGTGTLANGAMLPNHSNLLSHYNQSNTKHYGNTFWSMVKGDPHNTSYNNAWMGIYNGGSQTNSHVWWTWDLGADPSVKLKRMTNDWTWRTGSTTNFYVYGSNSLPNGGSNMTSSFVTTGLTVLLSDSTLSATEDNTFSNPDYYRYYVFRLHATGNPYDYGIDKVKWYGDYY